MELVYNSIRDAYEAVLDNGDILSVDAQAVSEAIEDRIGEPVTPFMDEDVYESARMATLDSSVWSEDMEGVSIIQTGEQK